MNEDLKLQHGAPSLARQETILTPSTPQISQASHASFPTKCKKHKLNFGRAQIRAKSELRPAPAPNLFFLRVNPGWGRISLSSSAEEGDLAILGGYGLGRNADYGSISMFKS